MNIEHLRRSLKAQWLNYYQENRIWLTRLGVWVNCEGNRRPSSSFILGTLSVLEPQLTQMLPLVVDLSSNPDRIIMALGLNFNPDEELKAIEQTSPEAVKLLTPFSVALPRLVQPLATEPLVVQSNPTTATQPLAARSTEPQSTEPQPTEPQPRKERSLVSQSISQPPAIPALRKPEPRKPEADSSKVEKSHSVPDSPVPDSPVSDSQPKLSPKPVVESEPLPVIKPALERPKASRPSFSEPVKQRPPMDTAELAQGQQPDRGTAKRKSAAPPTRT